MAVGTLNHKIPVANVDCEVGVHTPLTGLRERGVKLREGPRGQRRTVTLGRCAGARGRVVLRAAYELRDVF